MKFFECETIEGKRHAFPLESFYLAHKSANVTVLVVHGQELFFTIRGSFDENLKLVNECFPKIPELPQVPDLSKMFEELAPKIEKLAIQKAAIGILEELKYLALQDENPPPPLDPQTDDESEEDPEPVEVLVCDHRPDEKPPLKVLLKFRSKSETRAIDQANIWTRDAGPGILQGDPLITDLDYLKASKFDYSNYDEAPIVDLDVE
jgi:hypothetical protein